MTTTDTLVGGVVMPYLRERGDLMLSGDPVEKADAVSAAVRVAVPPA